MSVEIVSSHDAGYMKRAEKIMEFYNAESACPFDESLNLSSPESTRIIVSAGDSAGVLLDYHADKNIWRVMFAAFESCNRGRGRLRECLAHAESQGMDVALVEINGGDEAAVWERLGYTHFGSMGMCMTLSSRRLDFINYNAVMA